MKAWRLIPLALFLALCGFFLVALFRENPGQLPSVMVDKPLPSFSLATVSEPQRTVSEVDVKGEVALLNIWATWCPSCQVEHPFFLQLAQQGVAMYGINYKDDNTAAQQWLAKLGNPYRFSVQDPDGDLGIDLGVYGAPETYLIDHNGVIRFKHVGVLDQATWQQDIGPLYQQLKVKQNKEVAP